MLGLKFRKILFVKTNAIFLALTILWTAVCTITVDFTNRDKGFVEGLGFLILFAFSIYLGQTIKRLKFLGSLVMLTIATFLTASFTIAPLVGLTTNAMLLYSIMNSIFVSIVMTVFVDKIINIDFMIFTCLCLLGAYFLIDEFSNMLYMDYNIHPGMTMFGVFQLALIVPLTLGMTVKRHFNGSHVNELKTNT